MISIYFTLHIRACGKECYSHKDAKSVPDLFILSRLVESLVYCIVCTNVQRVSGVGVGTRVKGCHRVEQYRPHCLFLEA